MRERTHDLTSAPHVIVFATHDGARRWAREELVDAECVVECTSTVASLVTRLSAQPGFPTIAVVDFDGLSDEDLTYLRATRSTWKGSLIALGRVPSELRDPLRVRSQIDRPLGSEALRKAVGDVIERRGRRMAAAPLDLGTLTPVADLTHEQLRPDVP